MLFNLVSSVKLYVMLGIVYIIVYLLMIRVMSFLFYQSWNLQNIRPPHHLVEITQIKNRLNTKALKK